MKIGILTGGGDVPPLNTVINRIRERAFESGNELIGFVNGWDGVLKRKYIDLNKYENFSAIGGTFLKSSRINLLSEPNGIESANAVVKELGLDGLVIIGGDDTLSNAYYIENCPCVLISKTIDNDLGFINEEEKILNPEGVINYFTLGYPTAANKIASYASIDEGLRTTAYSHERIIILESMGMHSGWLALASGYGDPDFIIIPEFPLDYDAFCERLVALYQKQKHAIVVIAEGAKFNNDKYIQADYGESDHFNNPRFGGSSFALRDRLKKDLKKNFDTRNVNAVNPSYLYRSGMPNALDREIAEKIANLSFQMLVNRQVKDPVFMSVSLVGNEFVPKALPLSFFQQTEGGRFPKRQINKGFYDQQNYKLTSNGYSYFRNIIDKTTVDNFNKKSKENYHY